MKTAIPSPDDMTPEEREQYTLAMNESIAWFNEMVAQWFVPQYEELARSITTLYESMAPLMASGVLEIEGAGPDDEDEYLSGDAFTWHPDMPPSL